MRAAVENVFSASAQLKEMSAGAVEELQFVCLALPLKEMSAGAVEELQFVCLALPPELETRRISANVFRRFGLELWTDVAEANALPHLHRNSILGAAELLGELLARPVS
jgi:hypothetical protein